MNESHDVTRLLQLAREGDPLAESRLYQILYAELRRLAASCMRADRRNHTLQPTALVNEAYRRLYGQRNKQWESRGHFLCVAAKVMRQVLIDCARVRKAKRRWPEEHRVEFGPELPVGQRWDEELLDIHAALNKLAKIDLRAAQVVELRFFGGLGEAEIARLFGISDRTVKRDWEMARAWLEIELSAYAKNHRGPNNGNHRK